MPHLKVLVSSLSMNRAFFRVYKNKEPEFSGLDPQNCRLPFPLRFL